MRTPWAKRRAAMGHAYFATLGANPKTPDMAAHFLDRALTAAGYKVVKIKALRQRAAEDGSALEAAGDSANH